MFFSGEILSENPLLLDLPRSKYARISIRAGRDIPSHFFNRKTNSDSALARLSPDLREIVARLSRDCDSALARLRFCFDEIVAILRFCFDEVVARLRFCAGEIAILLWGDPDFLLWRDHDFLLWRFHPIQSSQSIDQNNQPISRKEKSDNNDQIGSIGNSKKFSELLIDPICWSLVKTNQCPHVDIESEVKTF